MTCRIEKRVLNSSLVSVLEMMYLSMTKWS